MSTRNNGQWTEARFHSFVKSALRAASRRWPPKYQALADACVGQYTNKKTGRMAKHYTCADCRKEFPGSEVQVDHIDPIIDPAVGFQGWDKVVAGMFCEREKLQVLCLRCHKDKTMLEKAAAVAARRGRKDGGRG